MMKRVFYFLFVLVCSMFMLATPAAAYIDPSAVTFIIQIIAASVIVTGTAIGFYLNKIKRAIKKDKSPKSKDMQRDLSRGADEDKDEYEYMDDQK